MPPVKDEKTSPAPMNTSAQIQQIFSEIQSQLPTVNFDTDDDQNDNDNNDEILETHMPENTDALLESLLNSNTNSFLTIHPKIESPQQPPSVELQLRGSPNLFDHSVQNPDSPPKPSILSMDLFNTIDFDKLPSLTPHHNLSQPHTLTRTFNRPRPSNHRHPLTQQQQHPQTNNKNRDDRQILERLTQQANKFNVNDRSNPIGENRPFRNLEAALSLSTQEHVERPGRRYGLPESDRRTFHIDLRSSTVEKQEKTVNDQPRVNVIQPISRPVQPLDSDSDDDDDGGRNDGMLWFERRQQQKLKSSK